MAINRQSLHLLRVLRVDVGNAADQTTRALTRAWVRAWDDLAVRLRAATDDVVAEAVRLGRWPQPWELARVERLQTALVAAEQALAQLGQRAGVDVSDAAGTVIRATADQEPRLIAAQLPAGEQSAAVARFAARILPSALDVMVVRTQSSIINQTQPLSTEAMVAMRRELVTGIALGANPRESARRMLASLEGDFNGGLGRAMNIARTEVLDAYRTASRYAHTANADVLAGWRWLSTRDRRVCPSCLAMNGSVHPATEPGPMDHQQGRCARCPEVLPWSALGIGLKEPPSIFPDTRKWFGEQPEATQFQIMGPARLELLQSGRIGWDDLATRREPSNWRPSYTPTSVRDLEARAAA